MNNLLRRRELVKNMGMTLLAEGKTIRIKAHGYSMYPCIKPGALILIEPINIGGLPVPGEILAIKREEGLIVHRLIRIVSQSGVKMYIARGDSNAFEDKPVANDKIAGRIIRAETTGENTVLADIKINKKPNYFLNRIRVIFIFIWKKIR
jgi:signal peptidase I